MHFATFKATIRGIVRSLGDGTSVFFVTTVDGKFIAYISDGTQITGNSLSTRVTVRWGNRNHLAQAEI